MSGAAKNLRTRTGEEAKVTTVELFFDLVYAFAITQLSHRLIYHLTGVGVLETLILWFAVWLGWQYTCWVTNWFDPDRIQVRLLLFVVMLLSMGMAASIPAAFDARGMTFALCYASMQVARSAIVLSFLGASHDLTANFRRILGWVCIAAVFWIAGALTEGTLRLVLWACAVGCEYFSPMFGFALPVLGRSTSLDWQTAEGGHIAERCQLFVIIGLGESLLASGGTLTNLPVWAAPIVIAFLVSFLGSVAMWWVYFDTSSHAATEAITHAKSPGQMAAYFHYVHVALIAGVITVAAGDDLVIRHPDEHIQATTALVLIGGPALFLIGNTVYKRTIYGRPPLSHLIGLALLVLVALVAFRTDLLMVSGLTTMVLIFVAAWETWSRRRA